MQTDNLDYFRRRADEERQIAATSEDNAVAAAHLKMADEYQKRVEELRGRPTLQTKSGNNVNMAVSDHRARARVPYMGFYIGVFGRSGPESAGLGL